MQRVLITGGGGQLASGLEALLTSSADVYAPSRSLLDLTEDSAVGAAFDELRPTLVLNCAAFHNVEVCEREEDRAFAVNVQAVQRLGVRCAQAGSQLVHVSTNYVFDGTAAEPHDESDSPPARSAVNVGVASWHPHGGRARR